MPTVLTSSQQTFVDITDQRKLSAYITSNLPKSQIEDPNVLPHTYAPDWASTPLTLTPVVFLDQTNLALDASGLTISWKRKEGNGAEAALTIGQFQAGNRYILILYSDPFCPVLQEPYPHSLNPFFITQVISSISLRIKFHSLLMIAGSIKYRSDL